MIAFPASSDIDMTYFKINTYGFSSSYLRPTRRHYVRACTDRNQTVTIDCLVASLHFHSIHSITSLGHQSQ
jgi:hypothetical protein